VFLGGVRCTKSESAALGRRRLKFVNFIDAGADARSNPESAISRSGANALVCSCISQDCGKAGEDVLSEDGVVGLLPAMPAWVGVVFPKWFPMGGVLAVSVCTCLGRVVVRPGLREGERPIVPAIWQAGNV
jgi:hypothetical protein